VVRVEGGMNWVTRTWNLVAQKSLRGTNLVIQDWWFIGLGVVWIHSLELYNRCISRMRESFRSRVKLFDMCQSHIVEIVNEIE